MPHPKSERCSALTEEGTQCDRDTVDSTRMCAQHRRAVKRLLEVEMLHCHACPLTVRGPSGAFDLEASRARCGFAFMHAAEPEVDPTGDGPCQYEIVDFFQTLDRKEDFIAMLEGVVIREDRLLKRATRFQTAPDRPVGEALRLADQLVKHATALAEMKGVYRPVRASLSVPVKDENQRAEIVDALLHGGEPVRVEVPKPHPLVEQTTVSEAEGEP